MPDSSGHTNFSQKETKLTKSAKGSPPAGGFEAVTRETLHEIAEAAEEGRPPHGNVCAGFMRPRETSGAGVIAPALRRLPTPGLPRMKARE